MSKKKQPLEAAKYVQHVLDQAAKHGLEQEVLHSFMMELYLAGKNRKEFNPEEAIIDAFYEWVK